MTLPTSLARLVDAINAHDPDLVAAAFTADFVCETPTRPADGFTGSARVRANYTAAFARTPDLTATVLRWSGDGDVTWSEWEMRGTATDGTPVLIRGVAITTSDGEGPVRHTRFYLDPVADG